ncbi:MAG: ABC transporter ATP-binding protein [Armatimonadetes bacterium]|nr:ABC transporter ATP-binding protein [Armatimonadota bacterium]
MSHKRPGFEEEKLGGFKALVQLRSTLLYVRGLTGLLALCGIGSLATSLLRILLPLLMARGIDGYVLNQDLTYVEREEGLLRLAWAFLGLLVLNLALDYYTTVGLSHVGQRAIQAIRRAVWERFHQLPIDYFDRNPVGRLVTRVANDTNALLELFTSVLATGVGDVCLLAGILAVMLALNPQLTLILLILVPPMAAVTLWFKNASQVVHREIRVLTARLNAFLQENVQGVAVVKSFTAHARMKERFAVINQDYFRAEMAMVHLFALFRPAYAVVQIVATAVLLWFGGLQVLQRQLSIGELVAFLFYLRMLFSPLQQLAEKFNLFQGAVVASERIFRILETPPEPGYGGSPPEQPFRGRVEFRDVEFAYDPEKPVLRGVTFAVEPGQKVALVGPTGSGKTTVAALLLRFYALEERGSGEILVDGRPIQEWPVDELRRHIGMVQQNLFLFSTDLRRNIVLYEDIPEERLEQALEVSRARLVVERMPEGLDRMLGERGADLSQGERQLLSFARALAFSPEFLVLDEATASVDSKTEQAIQDALRELLEARTALVIAHRLSTVQEADRIVVLNRGKVVEQGTHRELLAKDGLYAHLYRTQTL